ncbi:MAG: class I SAM-dependent methyltransferase [bacterium]|nr:class I SAM-dependent methyltransferase [bacterium]
MFHPKGPTFFELARQALSSTKHGYDLLADKFDYTPFRTPKIILEPVYESLAADGPVGDALDICCGTGAGMQMLRPLVTNRLEGVDMSAEMLRVAESNLAALPGEADLKFTIGDALALPYESEFDLAVCFGAHGHILPKDEPQFVEQIVKALKPGGRFVYVSSSMPSMFSPARWLATGFNVAMQIRNLIIRPPFIMYYLTFLLPESKTMFEQAGCEVELRSVYEGMLRRVQMVVVRKPNT